VASQEILIEQAAQIFVASERTTLLLGDGAHATPNAVANIQEIVNLMLLRGQIGKPGAGLCPVRGHSNVAGRSDGWYLGTAG
jgi:anaerobic selenocysteine-containing dehydrogenase